MIPRLLTSSLILFTFHLSSCVEGEEEIWINADLSGRLVVHYELPSIVKEHLGDPETIVRTLHQIDEQEEGIKINSLTFETSGKVIFHLDASFNDVLDLLDLADRNEDALIDSGVTSSDQLDAISGGIAFKIDGLTPTFNRDVPFSEMLPSEIPISPWMLGSSNFKYIIHLPSEVKETDAHFISEDRRTVGWTFLLKDHFDKPLEMNLTTKLPVPWWTWLILALIAFLVAWLIWRFVIRRFLQKPVTAA